MTCKTCNDLLMKMMDSTISTQEQHALCTHTQTCTTCNNAHTAYTQMLTDFAQLEQAYVAQCTALDGFEQCIMEKIGALAPHELPVQQNPWEVVLCWVFGSISASLGIALLIFMNEGAIMHVVSNQPILAPIVHTLTPWAAEVVRQGAGIVTVFSALMAQVLAAVPTVRFALIGACAFAALARVLAVRGMRDDA